MDLIDITSNVFKNVENKRKKIININVPDSIQNFTDKYNLKNLCVMITFSIRKSLLEGKFNILIYIVIEIVRFFKTYKHENPFKASDAVFFYLQSSIAFSDIIEYNEILIDIVLAYAYSDNDIDDKRIHYDERVKLSNDMIESCTTKANKFTGGRAIIASKLKQYPQIANSMHLIMKEQHRSIMIQRSNDSSMSEFKDVCFRKGAYTSLLVLHSIVSNPSIKMKEYAVMCGIVGQMLDDLVDVEDDIHDGVNTYATEMLKHNLNLDEYIMEFLGIYHEVTEHECATDFIKNSISRFLIITAVYRNTNKISNDMYNSFSHTISYFAIHVWYLYKYLKILGTVIMFR